MAAVQDLFRRLKLRRSGHKRQLFKDTTAGAVDAAPRLGDRTGVALPPLPPPGFMNLPDISRDCAQSPRHYYDEIPAYAIDTRLDILRDAYLQRNRADAQQNKDSVTRQTAPTSEDSSRFRSGYQQDFHMPQWNHKPQRHYSLSRDDIRVARRTVDDSRIAAKSPHRRQATPWNRGYSSDCEDAGSPDQLDQWVPVQEDLDSHSIEDLRINSRDHSRQPRHEKDSHCNVSHRQHTWGTDQPRVVHDNTQTTRAAKLPRGVPSSPPTQRSHNHPDNIHHAEVHHHHQHHHQPQPNQVNNCKYPSPPPGTLSDDSGVSSPSSREDRDTPCGPGTVPPGQGRPCARYSDSDSSMYGAGNPKLPVSRWYDQNVQRSTNDNNSHSQTLDALDISCEGSSDTYNEYDQNNSSFSEFGTYPRTHANESMTPQQYTFYLSKTKDNLKRTHLVQNKHTDEVFPGDITESELDVTIDSIDLTSVTSMSEMSTLSDDEICRIQQSDRRGSQHRTSSRVVHSTREHEVITKGHQKPPPLPKQVCSSGTTSQSAFKPYPSKRRYSHTPSSSTSCNDSSISPTPSAIQLTSMSTTDMHLADKLSCRATVSKPRPTSGLTRASTLQLHESGQMGMRRHSHGQGKLMTSTHNMLLSDIMRINHDRQILSLL